MSTSGRDMSFGVNERRLAVKALCGIKGKRDKAQRAVDGA
jgi:hypothetical protein